MPAGGSPVLKSVFTEDVQRGLTGAWNGEVRIQEAARDATGLLLPSNSPSINARLAALESAVQAHPAKQAGGAASLTEKEKAIAAMEADRAGLDNRPGPWSRLPRLGGVAW